MLGETVRLHRWSAVLTGFCGVIVMLWPHLSAEAVSVAKNTTHAIGAFFGGVTILSTLLPASRQMGMGGMMAWVTGISPLLLGVLLLTAIYGIWRRQGYGRALGIGLALLMALIGGLGVPLVIVEEYGDADMFIPLATAVLLMVSSGLVLRYLLHPTVKATFQKV
jgi:drug/metabolite transporter (DMT)-like permease